MSGRWSDFALVGSAGEVATEDDFAILATRGIRLGPSIRELLASAGEGSLLGLFHVPLPASPLWERRRDTANAFRARGYWSGLSAATWSNLTVFAADARGWALATLFDGVQEEFYILAPSGAAVQAGHGTKGLLRKLPAYALASFPTKIPAGIGIEGDYRRHLAIEIAPVYVQGPPGAARAAKAARDLRGQTGANDPGPSSFSRRASPRYGHGLHVRRRIPADFLAGGCRDRAALAGVGGGSRVTARG